MTLYKIVVMREGVVQQIGSPNEIYLTPANLFVADFMGSPAVNLLHANVRKNGSTPELYIERPTEPRWCRDNAVPDLPERVVGESGPRTSPKSWVAAARTRMSPPA